MTNFEDQLYADLLREHGSTLATTRPPAPSRRPIAPLLAVGTGGLTIAATAGVLTVAGGGTPAYALTTHANGTVTLDVYQQSGIAQINAKLRQLGDDQVVVVPVVPGCPRPAPPAVSPRHHRISIGIRKTTGGSVTVDAKGIPAGDIAVVGFGTTTAGGHFGVSDITSPPAPTCINPPPQPHHS
jgi:hypothetical protein